MIRDVFVNNVVKIVKSEPDSEAADSTVVYFKINAE